MILTDSSSAYAGSNQVRTIASFGFTTYADTTLSRVVSGTGIGILKNGSGTLTLSAANTYTGNATISAGTMSIINTGALPGFNTNGRFAVAPNATLAVYNAVTDAEVTTLRNTTNFKANAAIGFDTTSGNRTYTPTLSNTAQGALGVTKLGQNTLIIPTAGTYTGTTSVLVGTLSTFGANIIPDSSPIFLDTNGTLVLGGADTLATISGRGTLNCQSNNITLNSNNNSTFSGLLTSTASGNWSIYKQGTNTITLSGATIRVSGTGSVIRMDTGGMNLVGNTSFIQSRTSDGPRNFQMALNAVNTFNLTISGGASLTTAGCMFGENNGGSATVNLLSGGTWNSGGGGGQTWMAGLSSILNIDGGAHSGGLFYIGGGPAGTTSIINLNSGSVNLTNSLVWQGGGRCVFNLNGGTATFANFGQAIVTDNTFNFNGGTFTTQDGDYNYSYGGIKFITNVGNAVLSARPTRTITLTNAISGVGGIVKNGTGTLSLGNAQSTFAGQVSANEGTIATTATTLNDSTNGPLGNNTLPVVLGSSGKSATLAYTAGGSDATWNKGITIPAGATGIIDSVPGNTITLNGSVSGSGIFVKNGIGGLILGSTNNPYSGGTIHNNGLLAPTYNNSLGTGNINFNGGSIRSNITQDVSLNNTSSLSSNTTFPNIASEKSLTLLGATTLFGSTKTLTVNTGTTVAGKYINFAGPIGDNGNNYGIIKSGTGTLILSGNNTYGGNTTISDGTLTLANVNGFGTVGEIRFTSDSTGVLSFTVPSDISSRIRNNTNRVKLYGDNTTVSLTSLGSSNTGGLTITGQGTGNIILSGSGNSIVTNNASINCNSGTLTFADSISSRPVITVSSTANSTGTVNISGTFIQTNQGYAVRTFSLGEGVSTSTGTLNIYNSGYLQLSGGIMLAGNTAGVGIINLYSGGYLKMAPTGSTGELWIAGNSTLNVYGGTIDQSGGATLFNGGGGTGGTATTNFNISAGSVTCNTYSIGIGQATNVTANTNLVGGTFSITGFDFRNTAGNNVYNFYYNGGTFNIRNTTTFPAISNVVTTVRSGGAIFDINAGATVTHGPALLNGTGGGGLTKIGSGILTLSAINTYTGTTNISAGTLRVLKKISGTGSDASFTQADFTPTTLTVTFNSATPPSVGNTFKLFSGATLQTYGSVSLVNYGGTASYNSTNSTLTINT
jgi:fibronectin-binding autotransporter adhesin